MEWYSRARDRQNKARECPNIASLEFASITCAGTWEADSQSHIRLHGWGTLQVKERAELFDAWWIRCESLQAEQYDLQPGS